jgi:hypothetical protein
VTHSNPTCQDCSAAYCIAVAHLIRHPGDNKAAFSAASSWLQASRPGSEALTWLQEAAVDRCGMEHQPCERYVMPAWRKFDVTFLSSPLCAGVAVQRWSGLLGGLKVAHCRS